MSLRRFKPFILRIFSPAQLQKLPDQIFKTKSRLILLNLSDDLLLYGAQRFILSQSVDEFNVEVALGLNISEE